MATSKGLRDLLPLVEDVFSPGSTTLARYGLTFHEPQRQYALRVGKTMVRGSANRLTGRERAALTLLEASTGTGKTMGYAVPLLLACALSGQRAAISTFTVSLQDQIVRELHERVVPLVTEMTGVLLKVAVRYGIGNFVSYSAVAELFATKRREASDSGAGADKTADFRLLQALQEWARQALDGRASGLVHDFLEAHGEQRLPFDLPAAAVALSHSDGAEEKAAYQRHVDAAVDGDVLIVNHALLVVDCLHWFRVLNVAERPVRFLVADEADRLGATAESIYTQDIPLRRAMGLVEQLAEKFGRGFREAAELMADLTVAVASEHAAHAQGYVLLGEDRRAAQMVRQYADAVATALRGPVAALGRKSKASALDEEEAALCDEASDLMQSLDGFLAVLKNSGEREAVAALGWSPIRSYPSLKSVPLHPGRVLNRLWVPRDGVPPLIEAAVFTSATLGIPGGKPETRYLEFMQGVGIFGRGPEGYRPDLCEDLFGTFEPERFGKAMFILADPSAPSPSGEGRATVEGESREIDYSSEEWRDYAATMVLAAHKRGGRTLVLTTSYRDTRALARRLEGRVRILLEHVPGGKMRDYRDTFQATENKDAVWLTPGAWEGLNLPGVIDNVVITRIPFGRPDQVRLAALVRRRRDQGGSARAVEALRYALMVNEGKRRLRQGIGRGIRRDDDRVRVWIADPRFPLPQAYRDRRDPKLREGEQVIYAALAECLPLRFLRGPQASFPRAKVFLMSGEIYAPKTSLLDV